MIKQEKSQSKERRILHSKEKQVLVIHGGDAFATYEEYLSFLRNYKVDLESLKRKG